MIWQSVDRLWIDRSLEFGRRLVAHYSAGGSPQSLAVSGDRGTEKNPNRQAQGKLGECALALYLGLDPERDVKWNLKPDGGADITCKRGERVDVKTTQPRHKLIWSRNVNHLYQSKQFDFLVSCSVEQDDFSACRIDGFISKQDFFEHKLVADAINSRLEAGTWFVDKAILQPIPLFWHGRSAPFEHYCHCGKWGAFGYGVHILKGQEGKWFCRDHRPTTQEVPDGVARLSTDSIERDSGSSEGRPSSADGPDADRSGQDEVGGRDRQRRKGKKEAGDLRGTGDLFGRPDC